jgi:hypothetical protein
VHLDLPVGKGAKQLLHLVSLRAAEDLVFGEDLLVEGRRRLLRVQDRFLELCVKFPKSDPAYSRQ